jgi:hypothetical protein
VEVNRSAIEAFDRILFWECVPSSDRSIFERVRQSLPRTKLYPIRELVDAPLPVSKGDFMLSARFHPHLLGARLGAHGAYIADGEYYDVKHGSAVECGSGFVRVTSSEALATSIPGSSEKLEQLQALHVGKIGIADRIYPSI